MKMNTKIKSKKQEGKIAKEIGGKTTIASGATWIQKADVRNDKYLVEAKTTMSNSYTLSLTTWDRIRYQATKDGLRIPLMCIDLFDGEERLAIMSNLDLWGLATECGYDSSTLFVGDTYVKECPKSIKITDKFLYEDIHQQLEGNQVYIRRTDFKLGMYNLSIITWEDFLFLENKLQEIEEQNVADNKEEIYL